MIWFDLYGLEDRWGVQWNGRKWPKFKLTPKNDLHRDGTIFVSLAPSSTSSSSRALAGLVRL